MTRLAVDFGARFADLCLTGPEGRRLAKQPVGDDPVAALMAGLAALDVTPAALDDVRIASTRPLNMMLAQTPGPVALICTQGFGDVLELARQDRVDLYAPVARSAAPLFLAPRDAIHEIPGRIGPDGTETAPLDLSALDRIVPALRDAGVQAVAVCLLFAHATPAHEQALARALSDALPGVSLSLSHAIDPAPREYERTVGTVMDAWLRCTARPELAAMETALRDAGFAGALSFGDGRGVVRAGTEGLADLVSVLASGPAAAARGALTASGGGAVVLDVGSRSADLMLVQNGAPVMADPGQIAGIPLRRDLVDMASLALGGTSPVALDAGRLRLDADDAPTLDALLIADGRLPGDTSAPADRKVLDAVAARLAEEAIRFATRRNVDPVQTGLVVCGGTGGLLAADIARAMGLNRVRLPRHPAAAGATGLADAPERLESSAAVNRLLAETDIAGVFAGLASTLGDTPDLYRLSIAPRPEMHPMTLDLPRAPADADEILQAWRDAYAARYEIEPPGPGHLGRVAAIRDRLPDTASDATADAAATEGPALVATDAGGIWVPQGWRLSPTAAGYLLENRA
ncbi:hydantoinase/oxoprolinase N-terminal domain-containing protein [Psychromarinibacter halotolerans]|uniref:Hydantoinase/oxoprolinase N-terminal domain-containing protein n=1 Tax=Psychromarinibacter halotolerans TaxID=1775175 RepID=A0ABV7GVX6_9RHOB|nr:hydantoinase/oxoprolinase N-terminal domain-containing protein [Psychromarinibacter halotolerans]MDF0595175.1 hydantoinase/oxoprolinase N-terminal domain-containing protein [Psychromarinibacter halotolerans]